MEGERGKRGGETEGEREKEEAVQRVEKGSKVEVKISIEEGKRLGDIGEQGMEDTGKGS